MIHESSHYKIDLQKEVKKMKALFKRGSIRSEKRLFELEKFLFVSAFLIRKLIESKKLSDELESEEITIEYSEIINLNRTKDYFGKWKIDENYDVENIKQSKISLVDLVNLFIHSHVLFFSLKKFKAKDAIEKFELILTSDWKAHQIFYLRLSEYLKICKAVIKDDIVFVTVGVRNKSTGIRSILVKSRKYKDSSEFEPFLEKLNQEIDKANDPKSKEKF